MSSFIEFIQHLMDPNWIMQNGGLFLVAFIVFAETGLFIGFFLPGDYLIFITGIVIRSATENMIPTESHFVNLIFWIVVLTACAIIGNLVGYWFGKKSGNYLFERKDTWLLKKKHIIQAQEFYDKRGSLAIVVARFLPVVRTFAPIVAGAVKMDYKKFVFYNILGGILWITSLSLAGYLLAENVWVREHLEYIVIGLILITTIPVMYKMIFSKKKEDPTKTLPNEND